MLSQPIGTLESTRKVVTASPRTSVAEAVGRMLAEGVSAVAIVDEGVLAGIFTEHDVIARVVGEGRDPQSVRLDEVMTRDPRTVAPEELLGHALVVMQERRIRHLVVVEDGKPVGMVCGRNALDPELENFICEEIRRKTFR